MRLRSRQVRAVAVAWLAGVLLVGCSSGEPAAKASPGVGAAAPLSLVPLPSQLDRLPGDGYPLTAATSVRGEGGADADAVAADLAALLRPTTGLALPVRESGSAAPAATVNGTAAASSTAVSGTAMSGATAPSGAAARGTAAASSTAASSPAGASSAAAAGTAASGGAGGGGIEVRLDPGAGTGAEGYRLVSGPTGVVISATSGAGLFHGVQTLRQLLPPKGAATVPAVRIADQPRYGYRSGGLDVSRHFFTPAVVKDYIDLLARYKFNYLRLHLSDDQGWRIAIPGLPALTGIGASTSVGGSGGGFYTDAEYKDLVAYAAARYITVVPEVDLPGHSNAALTAYPDLGCPGDEPAQPYTGTDVGFSRLCTSKESTYTFVDQVVSALAEMTPGPYIGIGGDEARTLEAPAYASFITRVTAIVRQHGKQPLAWDEASAAGSAGPSQLEVWHPLSQQTTAMTQQVVAAAKGGAKLVMAPADRAYLDQQYDETTELGLHWAGYLSVEKSYDWNPDTYLPGLPAGSVTGVEAPIWTETLLTEANLQTMLLPRLPALAEVAWTPQARRGWMDFRQRLGAQAPYWDAAGLAYTQVDEVDWK